MALIIPWIIEIGPLRLSVCRFILLATILPCLVVWARGGAGRVRTPDVLVILFCVWCTVSLAVVHDVETAIQSGGMIVIETIGPYFLARACIRNSRQFKEMVLITFLLIVCLLPFSLYEALTGKNLLLGFFGSFFPVQMDYYMMPRWGLRRVQSVFDHPILYGVFCTIMFALVYRTLGRSRPLLRRGLQSVLVGAATFLSLSSGPISALVVQGLFLSWDTILKGFRYRWHLLTGFFAALYIGVSLLSNQSVFEFYVHYFAFSQDTGWDRIRIWHYGWISVFNHPIFGIGHHDYQRPEWMEPSIDMFWLINFVRFGYPAGLLMFMSFCTVFVSTAFKTGLNGEQHDYRMGFLISMVGIFTVGWTVHFWNAPYLLILFYLGSAAWLLDVENGKDAAPAEKRRRARTATRRSP